MSAVTVKLTNICSGGGHLTLVVSGDASLTRVLELSMLSEQIDAQDVDAFLKVICKLAKKGRTVAQAKTLLQVGVTVAV